MSFFSKGFASMLNERRLKKAAKKGSTGNAVADSGSEKAAAKEEKKDEGRWDRLTDAYGRTYWQHSVTGEWSYGVGGSLVSPVIAVNPSPVVAYPAGALFTPSPIFAPPPPPPAKTKDAKKKNSKKKDEKKREGKGWWEAVYDDHGNRYWEHTVTQKTTYKDPYF